MSARHNLVLRNPSTASPLNPTTMGLLIALLSLVLVGILLTGSLYLLRHMRQSQQRKQPALPLHNPHPSQRSNHRRLTITASSYNHRASSIYVYTEKQSLVDHASDPPASPIPEIRITFPEEEDEAGKRTSGRVVVVRIGEREAMGLEPLVEENLPPYEQSDAERFQSLDLERMGGLKEKEEEKRWS
ncbi:MAG: hypothetical protein FRX48_09033 [Lasallia pustulata]|uniref:Uncharacterized protein n=1 Tax=Lasallia pustulata TaxID=136370 RepID=A0A5M8PD71_9LECA|nr:MAG: hypothetical protein FRX48_09033 [Lasallia pustulata]